MRHRVIPVLVGTVTVALSAAGLLSTQLFARDAHAQTIPIPSSVRSGDLDAITPEPPAELVNSVAAQAAGVSPDVLDLAVGAIRCAVHAGDIAPPPTLTLIDYSRPSTEPRLWVFDLRTGEMRFRELVAHGKGTGDNAAQFFSDETNSHQSSLGLFVTADTYVGTNGYSLRLDGLEPGFNGRARERAIVMHGAPYVDAAFADAHGRLGRSWGCPALREAVARQVIDFVRGGGVIFSYYPDAGWLRESRFLNCGAGSEELRVAARE